MQEPGENGTEIMNGIRYVRPGNNFVPDFPMFKKIDVNGEDEHPLFTFLKSNCQPTRNYFAEKDKLIYDSFFANDIRWNWEKFLVNREGKPVMRYDPKTEIKQIREDVQDFINAELKM